MSVAPHRVVDQDDHADGFVSLSRAAEHYDMSTRSLRRMIDEGSLPAYRVGKRQIRIRVTDLETLARPIPTALAASE
jgi:excisionase family DNA binding protein